MAHAGNIVHKKHTYSEIDLSNALNCIKRGMSIRKAAVTFGIPYPTLRRRLIKSELVENVWQAAYNSKPSVQLIKEEQDMLQNAALQQHNTKNIDEAENVEDDTFLNDWKGNAFSSDISETETSTNDWKPATYKVNINASKKRKVVKAYSETVNNRTGNGFLQAFPLSFKDTSSPAPPDWTSNNEVQGRSLSHEVVTTTNNNVNGTSDSVILETLKVCKQLLQQKTEKIATPTHREEIFCDYLCTEIKKVTCDKIFQKLKLDILQLVNNALEVNNKLHCARTFVQEIKVEPEIIIGNND